MADKDTILTSQSELLALGKLRVLAFLRMNTFSLLNTSVHGISRMCCCNMLNYGQVGELMTGQTERLDIYKKSDLASAQTTTTRNRDAIVRMTTS